MLEFGFNGITCVGLQYNVFDICSFLRFDSHFSDILISCVQHYQ